MFEWNKKYEVGVDFVDEQHQKLFEIGNRAYELNKNDFYEDKYDKIVEIINELEAYTEYHFSCEEEYMQKIGYRKFLSHKVEHDDFIKKLKEVDFKSLDSHQDKYLDGILSFVCDWISEHILIKDRHYTEI